MKRITKEHKSSHGLPNKGIMLLVVLALPLFLTKTAFAENGAPASFGYWHVWTDPQGVSHQKKCEIRNFVLQSIEPPAAPQWLNRLKTEGASVVISVLPAGWIGIWHENPKPQWIIPISGRWYVQTMDGQRVEMGPGDVSFGEDQNTKPDANGHKGHLSATVGNEPCVLMMIQLKNSPTVNQPCRFD
jgi:quercetin dioxygenase-like cupin family protein